MSYRVEPYDNPKRWLVIKDKEIAYLVQLNYFGPGRHCCFCRWFETKSWEKEEPKPCKHIRMVERHIAGITK